MKNVKEIIANTVNMQYCSFCEHRPRMKNAKEITTNTIKIHHCSIC